MHDDEEPASVPIQRAVQVGQAGGLVDETRVTLALYGESLRPDEVSNLLGVQPTYAHERGDLRKHTGKPHRRGAWMLTVEGVAPVGPDDLLVGLLSRLPVDREFWRMLRTTCEVKAVVAVFQRTWNRGFGLRAETIALLDVAGVPLEFDLYCDGEAGNEGS